MAYFTIYNNAGTGGYLPYANTTVADMFGSYGTHSLRSDNGRVGIFHMNGTTYDTAVSYTSVGGTSVNINAMAFGNGSVAIGGIDGLNLTVSQTPGDEFDDVVINGGNDEFDGNDFADFIHAGAGNDIVWGWGGNDVLYGDSGNDVLHGDIGHDYMDGGLGQDAAMFTGLSSNYTVTRQTNGDVVIADKFGQFGSDYLTGVEMFSFGDGVFTLDQLAPVVVLPPTPPPLPLPLPPAPQVEFHGTNNAEHLTGNAANNELFGYGGNDTLKGGAGIDWLEGGKGADKLYGGSGNDVFVFNTSPKTGKDAIKDFSLKDDFILLENAVFKVGSSLSSSEFRVNNSGKAQDGNDKVIYDKDSGVLYYDADGTGSKAGVAFATITKGLKLSYHDFDIT